MGKPRLRRGINVADARELRQLWLDQPLATSIITSPPYLDMHDYGNGSSIGTKKQSISEYTDELRSVFSACAEVSGAEATMWVVIGSIRRKGRLISLPGHVADAAEAAGWTLREEITWDKQKSLPWTKHGELRDVTEKILLLSKGNEFRWDTSELRSPFPNSVWWRRYPERYSPEGRLPTNLWSVPIPTQGSWRKTPSHLCPFPPELTHNMLALTTQPGDVVLDPFAGVGSVPAMAEVTSRVGYGLELTEDFALEYDVALEQARLFVESLDRDDSQRNAFRQVIQELRLLKYARLLGSAIERAGLPVQWVRTRKASRKPRTDFSIFSADFEIVVPDGTDMAAVLTVANETRARAPLSKFGIDATIAGSVVDDASSRGYWFPKGYFWSEPTRSRPTTKGPHVVASFCPQPDLIDPTPYAPRGDRLRGRTGLR